MKRVISYFLALVILLSASLGTSLSMIAAPDSFYTSFESGDPVVDIHPVTSSGVTGTGTITRTLIGEFTNYQGTNPISVTNATGGTPSTGGNEGPTTLVDRDAGTKFCSTGGNALPLAFTFRFSSPITPKAYYIQGANDDTGYITRTLRAWTILASKDNENWVELDSRSNITWSGNHEMKMFEIENAEAYTYFRLTVTQRNNGNQNGGETASSTIQFSGFGLGDHILTSGFDGTTEYLYPQTTTGPSSVWGGGAGNKGWTGAASLSVNGTKTAENASSYTAIYSGLAIQVHPNTRLSYMVLPNVGGQSTTNYDYEYTSMYASIDLEFSDGTRLKDLGATDQYGTVVSPAAQGDSKIMDTNQWLRILSHIGAVASGKTISRIIVGFEKNGGTPGKNVSTYFDDIAIYREDDPVVTNLADYTNILRGTNNDGGFSRGLTVPAVTWPFGFNFWCPATALGGSDPYHWTQSSDTFRNIQISHEPSHWIGERGTYQFGADSVTNVTSTGAAATAVNGRGTTFRHDNEVAHAHYYGVTLDTDGGRAPGVKVEVTPTDHAAVIRFTFPAGSAHRNVLLSSNNSELTTAASNITYDGSAFATYSENASNGMRRMYVYGVFSAVPSSHYNVADNANRGVASFADLGNGPDGATVIELKVATSFLSADQAKKNLALEISDSDNFDTICGKALAEWNAKLSTVKIEGATYEQNVTFYSNLYRGFMYPNNLSENTGTNEAPDWRYASPYSGSTSNPTIKSGKLYYNNGFWDTYRTTWATYALLLPDKDTELLDGLVQHYLDNGSLPRWIAPAGTNSMVGTSSDVIFGDSIMRGIQFDHINAYKSALKNASAYQANGASPYAGRANSDTNMFYGYTYAGQTGSGENMSWSLEGYINDFGIGHMAAALRDRETPGSAAWKRYNDESVYYLNRARNYVNLYDTSVGFFKGRTQGANGIGGTLVPSASTYDPLKWRWGSTEQNGWNYATYAPQDAQGLANIMGGRDALAAKLDATIATNGLDMGEYGSLHEGYESREGKLGQFGFNNQPSHHIPYMYLFAGQAHKTQALVRDILDRMYVGQDIGQGYLGDEDNGEMSCWYVLSALGIYPVSMGNGTFAIGAPLFKKATITRDNGDVIVVNAPNNSKANKYVQGVKLDGQAYTKAYFEMSAFRGNHTIDFDMGPNPSAWGSGADDLPPSLTTDEHAPDVLKDLTLPTVSVSTSDMPAIDAATINAYLPGAANGANLFNNANSANATWTSQTAEIYYSFNKPAAVTMYTISSGTAAGTYPTAWTLYGTNDGTQWTPLDARAGESWEWARYTRPFTVETPGKYKIYRLSVTGAAGNLAISELELFGSAYAFTDKSDLLLTIRNGRAAVDSPDYGADEKPAITAAVAAGQAVYDDPDATSREISAAIDAIDTAIAKLIAVRKAWVELEAIGYNSASGTITGADGSSDNIKSEATSGVSGVNINGEAISGVTVTNIGGSKPGAWMLYKYIDFGAGEKWFTKVVANYAGVTADCPNAHALVHLDAPDGPVIADIAMPPNGSTWTVYTNGVGVISDPDVSGVHDVYIELQGTGKHVANIHSFLFQYESTSGDDFYLMGHGEDLLPTVTEGDGTLTVRASIRNNSGTERRVSIIAAVYAQDNRLAAVDTRTVTVSDGRRLAETITLDASALGDGYSVKVFAWDADDYTPLCAEFAQ
ncbi:MAG: GH92 family glycosyl hydrolase [Oscillospiraceae bacterium]|jgi:predicted alpha-1,2-mannosidase|nr:GH92 family glycosyl hydrolase [Oscillospiraceae bacterium]